MKSGANNWFYGFYFFYIFVLLIDFSHVLQILMEKISFYNLYIYFCTSFYTLCDALQYTA